MKDSVLKTNIRDRLLETSENRVVVPKPSATLSTYTDVALQQGYITLLLQEFTL